MFYYFFVLFALSCIPIILWGFWMANKENDGEFIAISIGLSVIFSGLLGACPTIAIWSCHADDLGTIFAQQEVISVYEKQRDDLNKTMTSFDYPLGSLMNADSPVRSIVEQLANVEKLLADARADKAKAIRSIEQRRVGPVSGVIRFAGDYK